MRPAIHAKWSVARVVQVQCICNVHIWHVQTHRTEFGIKLNCIDYQGIDPVGLQQFRAMTSISFPFEPARCE